MTSAVMDAVRIARDAEQLAAEAREGGLGVLARLWSDRAAEILEEVDAELPAWVRRTHERRMSNPYVEGARARGLARWRSWHETPEWTPIEWSRSAFWDIHRSVSTQVLAGEAIRAGDPVVMGDDGLAYRARVAGVTPQLLVIDDPPPRRQRHRPSPSDRQRGRAHLESLRSHRKRSAR